MSTVYEWNKYMNLLHEMALIEDHLRDAEKTDDPLSPGELLWEHFGGQA